MTANLPHFASLSDDSNGANTDTDASDSTIDTASIISGMEALSIEELVRLLPSMQPRVSQAASLLLRRKGMSEQNLTLAMELATGDADKRQALLQALVRRDDIDPRPWLLWMASDGEASVREQAIGLLSPLIDNEIRRQLRLLLNKERDEQVSQTIRRVLVQPSLSGRL